MPCFSQHQRTYLDKQGILTNPLLSLHMQVGLSQALESTVIYQLKVVADGVGWGGAALLPHAELIKKVIAAAFNAPSSKVLF